MPHRALCGPIVAHFGTLCFAFSGFEDAASAPSLRTNYLPLGLESCWGFPVSHACRTEPFADRLWHILARFALLLAVSKMPLRHPVCGRLPTPWACPLRTDCGTFWPAFALLLAVSKMPLRHPVCGRITYHFGLNPAGVSLFRIHAAQSPLGTDCGTFWHALLCF